MNIGLLFIVLVPLSVLVITPEIRRRRQNINNNNNNNNIINEVTVNNDNNPSYSYNIGKWIGNVISILIIISILISIRLLYSNLLSKTLSLSTSLISTCNPPVGINLIGIYGNIQGLYDIRNITTRKPETQILFKQGLIHLYGFNFEEANRNMQAALEIENDCIMCYWGLAFSNGPNINLGVYPVAAKNGRLAIQKAINLMNSGKNISQKEKELVYTQYERFYGSIEEWENKGQQYFDEKYAIAMKELMRKWPDDNDIAAEYVDSIMLLHPWDYYKNNYTILHDDIIPAYETLKKILISNPHHPLALHLWIHISEQGPNPSQALSQADMLMKSGEGIGHLVHMPSHIYFRIGSFEKCINSSLSSILTDNYYISKCLKPYVTNHNKALLVLCATYSGRYNLAVQYATPSALFMDDDSALYVSALFPSPKELIYARYGKWQNIIDLQNQENNEVKNDFILSRSPYIKSLRLYGKALALIRIGNDIKLIEHTLQEFKQAIHSIPDGVPPLTKGHVFYPYHRELGILMDSIVSSAWLMKRSFSPDNLKKSIEILDDAVLLQDSFLYMEPEHHYFPVRHCLASVLMALSDAFKNENNKYSINLLLRAYEVYEKDLNIHPNSGHVYRGIMIINEKLRILGYNETIISNANELYFKSWSHADVDINGSCCELNFC